MTTKSLLIIGALAISTVGIASAKSYSFTLAEPTKMGGVTLKPGEYEVALKGTEAVVTFESGKSYKAAVKVEQSDKKFDQTQAVSSTKDGVDSLKEIDLEGSATKLEFGQ